VPEEGEEVEEVEEVKKLDERYLSKYG